MNGILIEWFCNPKTVRINIFDKNVATCSLSENDKNYQVFAQYYVRAK